MSRASSSGRTRTDDEEWVLNQVRELTEPEPDGNYDAHGALWTGRRRIVGNKDKPGQPTREEIREALAGLKHRGEIVSWHGLLAPADEEHLQALVENETQADNVRKILVGQLNQLLAGKVPDSYRRVES